MFLINCLRVNSEIGSAEHDASNLLRRKTDRQTGLSVSLFSLSDSLSPAIPRKRESEKNAIAGSLLRRDVSSGSVV